MCIQGIAITLTTITFFYCPPTPADFLLNHFVKRDLFSSGH